MYLIVVILLMFVCPLASIAIEHSWLHGQTLMFLLVGKWFVFWSVGVRLLLAGLRQFFQPTFTAREIFGLEGEGVLTLVQELGVANFASGVVGVASLWRPSFVVPSALAAAIFYGVAGVRHMAAKHRSAKREHRPGQRPVRLLRAGGLRDRRRTGLTCPAGNLPTLTDKGRHQP